MAKHIVPICSFVAFSTAGLLFASTLFSASINESAQPEIKLIKNTKVPLDAEPQAPLPPISRSRFPSRAHLKLIGHIADGLIDWKTKRDRGWRSCGIHLKEKEAIADEALNIAYHAVRVSSVHKINPWGLVGTIANESAFDPCALGYHPRKWAVAKGYLQPMKQGISYTQAEVLSVISSEAAKSSFAKTGFDLGLCQMLTKFYKGPPEDLLSVSKGLEICAKEMAMRGRFYKTKRPWLYWRGKRTEWYDAKVAHLARRLGCRRNEI